MRDWLSLSSSVVFNGKIGDVEEAVGPLGPLLFVGLLVLNNQHGDGGVLPASFVRKPAYLRRSMPSFLMNTTHDEIEAALAALASCGLIERTADGGIKLNGYDETHWPPCKRCKKPNPSRFNQCQACRDKDAARKRGPQPESVETEESAESAGRPAERRDPPGEGGDDPQKPPPTSAESEEIREIRSEAGGNSDFHAESLLPDQTVPDRTVPDLGAAGSPQPSQIVEEQVPQYDDGDLERLKLVLQMAGVGDAESTARILLEQGGTSDDVARLRATVNRADDPGAVMVRLIRDGTWKDRLAAVAARQASDAAGGVSVDPHAVEAFHVEMERRGHARIDLRLHERDALGKIKADERMGLPALFRWIEYVARTYGEEQVPDYTQRLLSATADVWSASFDHAQQQAPTP